MKIKNLLASVHKLQHRISLELLPDRPYDSQLLNELRPLFCSIAWLSASPQHSPLKFAQELRSHGHDVIVHVPGRNFDQQEAAAILKSLHDAQLCNILVVQGDFGAQTKDAFPYAVDFVRFTRDLYADYFCIGVAANPDRFNVTEVNYLRMKIEAGADFVITQPVMEVKVFENFLQLLQDNGVDTLIIPGVYPFKSVHGLVKTAEMCAVDVPESVRMEVESHKDDPERVRDVGVRTTTEIAKKLFALTSDVHVFCLNDLQIVYDVCERLQNVGINVRV